MNLMATYWVCVGCLLLTRRTQPISAKAMYRSSGQSTTIADAGGPKRLTATDDVIVSITIYNVPVFYGHAISNVPALMRSGGVQNT